MKKPPHLCLPGWRFWLIAALIVGFGLAGWGHTGSVSIARDRLAGEPRAPAASGRRPVAAQARAVATDARPCGERCVGRIDDVARP